MTIGSISGLGGSRVKNKVYILGGAQTDFERNWTKEGKTMLALLKEVTADGLVSAGLSFDDIRGLNQDNRVACFVGNFIAEKYTEQGHLGAFLTEVNPAFYGVPSARYEAACASGSVAIDAAQTKIQVGDYDVAVVIGWELMKTVDSKAGVVPRSMTKRAKVSTFQFRSCLADWRMRRSKNMALMRQDIWTLWLRLPSLTMPMPSVILWLRRGNGS